jgi:hypothetical protein
MSPCSNPTGTAGAPTTVSQGTGPPARAGGPRPRRAHGKAFFSVFRVTGRHEAAGVWAEDVMNGSRRIWILDEGLEKSAPAGLTFGMRLFEPERSTPASAS